MIYYFNIWTEIRESASCPFLHMGNKKIDKEKKRIKPKKDDAADVNLNVSVMSSTVIIKTCDMTKKY